MLYGMHLINHGGKCCGIKTIMGFHGHPESQEAALSAIERNDKDQHGSDVSSKERFFHDAAPKETGVERLDRYLAYMRRRRPANIVEVVLAKGEYQDQPKYWEEILLGRGFKMVTKGRNSNSGNTCFIYHLVIDEWDGDDDDDDCEDDD